MPNATDTMPAARTYGLLGYPADFATHVGQVGPLPLPARADRDWGGALLFPDWRGHLAEGYAPAFNALNILAVPQPHLVGFVSPFACAHRLSITGWFRSR